MSKRLVDTDLWNNEDIVENFTAEDKYFWLYLLTSPHNNICGVFKNQPTIIARDMGLHKDTIVNLLYRFENTHKLIYVESDTKEILILNWYKFNWNKSPKLRVLIDSEFSKIQSANIKHLLTERIANIFGKDTVSIPYQYPTISNSIPSTINNGDKVVNNYNNTTHARTRVGVREELSIEQFEQSVDCVGWEHYPSGDVYVEVRSTLIQIVNDGEVPLWEISHDLLTEILESMFKGRERREITDLRAYILSIIQRKRKERRGATQ